MVKIQRDGTYRDTNASEYLNDKIIVLTKKRFAMHLLRWKSRLFEVVPFLTNKEKTHKSLLGCPTVFAVRHRLHFEIYFECYYLIVVLLKKSSNILENS